MAVSEDIDIAKNVAGKFFKDSEHSISFGKDVNGNQHRRIS
jgi:hypothetical protein